jgi:hypothetical protein
MAAVSFAAARPVKSAVRRPSARRGRAVARASRARRPAHAPPRPRAPRVLERLVHPVEVEDRAIVVTVLVVGRRPAERPTGG